MSKRGRQEVPAGQVPDDWRGRLRYAVTRSGLKHEVIAWEAGINPSTLSLLLNGKRYPRFETVARVAHAVGASVGWLLRERGYTFSTEERAELRHAAAIIIKATT